MLVGAVLAYLAASIAIGLYAARRVKSATDFAAAGRSLSLPIVVATVFATWFGAETVLGVSATFLAENLRGVVSDPFGASLALVLVALVFARPLYRLGLLTIGDYFRSRYGQRVEVVLSICIVIGYFGWTAAQLTALGLVFNVLSAGAIGMPAGVALGAAIVLVYTVYGGMWSVALTDFMQMIVIVAGLGYIAWAAADKAGGFGLVVEHAAAAGKFAFWPDAAWRDVASFVGAAITLMLGSIPQQDTYQRVTAARDERTAALGALIGGVAYLAFALVPMFLAYSATMIDPAMVERLMASDSQLVLPTLVLTHLPVAAQALFFGALLAAIMSSASAALLAPAVSLAANVIRPLRGGTMSDPALLATTRACVVAFCAVVLAVALASDASIFKMVENAYKVTLVAAFVPLAAGLFWRRATTVGAGLAIVLGLATWLACELLSPRAAIPPQLAGVVASALGMLVGSLAAPMRS